MNRDARRKIKRENTKRPAVLTQIPKGEWPSNHDSNRIEVWISQKFIAQVFIEKEGVLRVSINTTIPLATGRWKDGISWEELQAIKRAIGRGDQYGVEIFPRDRDVVNVANMRHLWLLPEPLKIGWFSDQEEGL